MGHQFFGVVQLLQLLLLSIFLGVSLDHSSKVDHSYGVLHREDLLIEGLWGLGLLKDLHELGVLEGELGDCGAGVLKKLVLLGVLLEMGRHPGGNLALPDNRSIALDLHKVGVEAGIEDSEG